MEPMPKDPFIREKFTRESSTARPAVREYFKRYPKEQFQTELETWRYLQSRTIEFTMKRLREPAAEIRKRSPLSEIDADGDVAAL
jgi:hypothetical protein